MTVSNHRNLVAKHSGKFNKSKVYKDRKKEQKRGYEKHRDQTSVSQGKRKTIATDCPGYDSECFPLARA